MNRMVVSFVVFFLSIKAQAGYTWDEIHVPALKKIYLLIEAPEDLICTSQCNKHWYAVLSQVDGIEKDKKGAPTGYWKRLVECKDPEVRKLIRAEQRAQSGKLEDVKPYLRLYKTFLPPPSEKDRLGPTEKNALKVVEFRFENHPETTEKIVFYTHYARAQKRAIQEETNLGKARQAFEQLKATQSGYALEGLLFFAWKHGLITKDDEPDAEKKRQETLSDLSLSAEQYYKEHTKKKEGDDTKGHLLYAKILYAVGKNFEETEGQSDEEGPSNAFKAFEAHEKCANLGYRKAQYELGKMYMSGRVIGAQDDESAVAWWEKAAKQGHAEAQDLMGLAYYLGFGDMNLPLERYEERTLHWWGLAAIQGHKNALLHLQHMAEHEYGFFKKVTIEEWSQDVLRKDSKDLECPKGSYPFIKDQENRGGGNEESNFARMLEGFEKELNSTSQAMNLYKGIIRKHPGAIYPFSSLLKTDTTLAGLELSGNNIRGTGAAFLARALKENTALTLLNLWDNKIGDVGAVSFSEALKENTALTALYLGLNNIGAEGARFLASALKENTTLRNLHLGWNKIGDVVAEYIANALKQNSTLRELYLEGNKIGDVGAGSLSDALKQNTTLRVLKLGSNQIGSKGAGSLSDALKENLMLTELDLGYNKIGAIVMVGIRHYISRNKSLLKEK